MENKQRILHDLELKNAKSNGYGDHLLYLAVSYHIAN